MIDGRSRCPLPPDPARASTIQARRPRINRAGAGPSWGYLRRGLTARGGFLSFSHSAWRLASPRRYRGMPGKIDFPQTMQIGFGLLATRRLQCEGAR